jgi:hypothetical protein
MKAPTHVLDDSVFVLMREGHTASETSMARGDRTREVAQQRVDLLSLVFVMENSPVLAEATSPDPLA